MKRLLLAAALLLSGCGYTIDDLDEARAAVARENAAIERLIADNDLSSITATADAVEKVIGQPWPDRDESLDGIDLSLTGDWEQSIRDAKITITREQRIPDVREAFADYPVKAQKYALFLMAAHAISQEWHEDHRLYQRERSKYPVLLEIDKHDKRRREAVALVRRIEKSLTGG